MFGLKQYCLLLARDFVEGRLTLQEFAEQFGAAYAFVREHPEDKQANQLASDLMRHYAQCTTEFHLRQSLAAVLTALRKG